MRWTGESNCRDKSPFLFAFRKDLYETRGWLNTAKDFSFDRPDYAFVFIPMTFPTLLLLPSFRKRKLNLNRTPEHNLFTK